MTFLFCVNKMDRKRNLKMTNGQFLYRYKVSGLPPHFCVQLNLFLIVNWLIIVLLKHCVMDTVLHVAFAYL